MTKEEIIKFVAEQNVHFIRLQFTDIFGTPKNVAITRNQLERALNNQIMFDGSSIEGFVRIEESDMYLYPDLDTFELLPWQSDVKEARLICDVYGTDGKPFAGDPRGVLRRVLAQALQLGYTCNVGPECEFFMFKLDENGRPTLEPNDDADYFDLGPIDHGEDARKDICLILEAMGFDIEALHHEAAPGQHEIDFKYADALISADAILTFKLVVKTVARNHKLHATFMPKPIAGIAGSGMHINISFNKNGVNAFYNENDELGLSKEAYSFIAGIMQHIHGIALLANPLVNSYKRLVPDHEAPVYIAWSSQNRSPLIRIPASRGQGTRVELRSADPSANPYLVLAAAIAAGLDGIQKGLVPPPSTNYNLFALTKQERAEKGIESLPMDLKAACDAFENDPFIRAVLGEHIFTQYLQAKRLEWEEYAMQVHEWEVKKYLDTI